jgi:hypothetical protein
MSFYRLRRGLLVISVGVILVTVTGGCPLFGSPEIDVSENAHGFHFDGTEWTPLIWNEDDAGSVLRFSLRPTVDWLQVSPTHGTSTGLLDKIPITVTADRDIVGDSPALARIEIISNSEYGPDNFYISINGGNANAILIRDYFPLSVGNSWTFSKHAEDRAKGSSDPLDLVETSTLTITSRERRTGITYWLADYDHVDFGMRTVGILYLDEFLVLVRDVSAFDLLPDISAAFWLNPDVYAAIYVRLNDGRNQQYTNTTQTSAGSLVDLAPIHTSFAQTPYTAGEFAVASSNLIVGLHWFYPPPPQFFELFALGVGPLIDPFGSGILTDFTLN